MPTQKLTKRLIDTAKPKSRDYELRDTDAPGFLCKITPAGRKTFMLQYRTIGGERRKPAIGQFGELTVEQARAIAHKWLAEVRAGKDPSLDRHRARDNPTIRELCDEFIDRHSLTHNKPSTTKGYRSNIRVHIKPTLGKLKVDAVTRTDVSNLMRDMAPTPGAANQVLFCLKKMMNCAELWGYRTEGTNPCRGVPKYPEGRRTRLIKNRELARLFDYLDRADAEGLEHPSYTLAIRLQFAFAARMSEIISLEWEWIDFEERRVVWPDSKTGGISKPLSDDAYRLLREAPRFVGSAYVVPGITNPKRWLSKYSYWSAWKRILVSSGLAHVGTHGIRHRSATDIANSGIPLKVGMALTAHKTVESFMRYVHVEDNQVRAAADAVATRRNEIIRSKGKAHSPRLRQAPETLPSGGAVGDLAIANRSNAIQLKSASNDR